MNKAVLTILAAFAWWFIVMHSPHTEPKTMGPYGSQYDCLEQREKILAVKGLPSREVSECYETHRGKMY